MEIKLDRILFFPETEVLFINRIIRVGDETVAEDKMGGNI